MASRFPEYTLPKGSAVLRPEAEGFAALETAGRRIGPAYDQAARDYSQIGKLQDEAFRAQDWPFDFAAFGSARGSGGGGVNFKVSNAGAGFGGTTDGGGGGRGSTGAFPRSYTPQTGRTARSAAELISTWAGNTPAIGPAILRGGRAAQQDVAPGALANPDAVVRGDVSNEGIPGVLTPGLPGSVDADQIPFGSAGNPNLGATTPGFDQMMQQVDPSPAPASSASWTDLYNGVMGAVGSAISNVTSSGGDYSATGDVVP